MSVKFYHICEDILSETVYGKNKVYHQTFFKTNKCVKYIGNATNNDYNSK